MNQYFAADLLSEREIEENLLQINMSSEKSVVLISGRYSNILRSLRTLTRPPGSKSGIDFKTRSGRGVGELTAISDPDLQGLVLHH